MVKCMHALLHAGRLLYGSLSLGQLACKGGAAPAQYRVTYVVPPAPNKDANGGTSKEADGTYWDISM